MRIFERRLEVFIGASVGSTSSRSWISGTDPAIATSTSENMIVVYILLFDEIRDQWELIMFSTAIAQRLATRGASPVQPSLVNEPFSDLGALRPHFENDVVLTRVITLRPESSFDRVEI